MALAVVAQVEEILQTVLLVQQILAVEEEPMVHPQQEQAEAVL